MVSQGFLEVYVSLDIAHRIGRAKLLKVKPDGRKNIRSWYVGESDYKLCRA